MTLELSHTDPVPATLGARMTQHTAQGLNKPVQRMIDLSSGEPHRAGIAPISFVRQVLAVSLYPELLQDDSFPLDVRQRAQRLLFTCPGGSVGAYCSTTSGIPYVWQSIADFISRRDGGVTADPNNVFISSGTQSNLILVSNLLSSGKGDTQTGVLTPVPYPHTLPNLLQANGLTLVPYRLMEDQGWAVDLDELHRALTDAREHCKPKAIFISNPGIPTGHVQDRETIERVIRFAAAEGLVLLVQEVYQDCVYGQGVEFVSYKKVLFEMGHEFSDHVELISCSSLSNGTLGECGLRGGYMEIINMDPAVKQCIRTLKSMDTPTILSQFALEIMVNPPAPGDASYQTYTQEVLLIQATLCQNARRGREVLNSLKGVNCRPTMGGIFLYPRLDLPAQMIEEAKMLGLPADVLYCQMLLEKESVYVGAGCENRAKDKSHYIRLSLAASPDCFQDALSRLCSFHLHLLDRYS